MPCRSSLAIASCSDIPSCSRSESRSWRRQTWGSCASRGRAPRRPRGPPRRGPAGRRGRSVRLPAPTGRPVRIRSSARPVPNAGSRTVPPSMSGTPQRRQKTPKRRRSAATRRSHQRASSRPPRPHSPHRGDHRFRQQHPGRHHRAVGSAPVAALVAERLKVGPAQKAAVAERTATLAPSSASNARNARPRPRAVGPSTALRARVGRRIDRGDRAVALDADGLLAGGTGHGGDAKVDPTRGDQTGAAIVRKTESAGRPLQDTGPMSNKSRGLRETVVSALAKVGPGLGGRRARRTVHDDECPGAARRRLESSRPPLPTPTRRRSPSPPAARPRTAGLALALVLIAGGLTVLAVGATPSEREKDVQLRYADESDEVATDLPLALGLSLLS